MIDEEDKPLFALVMTIGGTLLALLAAIIGVNPYERRIFLVLLFGLFFWNILSLVNFLDRRFANWFSYGLEIYFHKVSYWNGLYRLENQKRLETEQKLEEEKLYVAELTQELRSLRGQEREHKNRLADRERDLAAARKHIEDVHLAAQEMQAEINRLRAELNHYKQRQSRFDDEATGSS